MAKILVVEDDEFFRKAVCDLLRKKKHDVYEAAHGRGAMEVMSIQEFELVITDIQMPGMNGIELLEWSLKVKPVPFIVMTGFSTILETQSAYDLGAKDFISKPFKNQDLITIINKTLGIVEPTTEEEVVLEFCKISIDEFVFGKKLEFDIFVKLSATKYVKIALKGEELIKDRVLTYKEKGVTHLYITKEDFGRLVGFNINLAQMIKGSKSISYEKKVNFLKYTGEVILTQAFVNGVDKELFNEASTFMGLTMNTLTDSREHLDLLSLLSKHSEHIYAHSIGVSIYSIMIAQRMGFESQQAFFKLSIAAMFHDVGKKEIEPKILLKHRSQLTSDDKKLIDSHVQKGQEIIMSIKGIPEDVAQIVFEHHEDVAGLGYPMGTDRRVHHPLSKIIQLANLFVEVALAGPHSPGMPGDKTITFLEHSYADRYDYAAMKALKSIFAKPKLRVPL
jgi:putative nucleotidyltransferase with HDIG domain